MKRRGTTLIAALMFGGSSVGVACSSGDTQKGLGSSGTAGAGGRGAGGDLGVMTPVLGGAGGAGGGGGGAGGASCIETALTNCTGTTSGAWCVDQFLQNDPVAAEFTGIWGSGTTNVWAVGSRVDSSGIFNSSGFAFHWDGCAWTRSPLSIAAGLREVWGMTDNDVWAVGDGGTALHWNGSAWTPVSTGVTSILWGVSGTATDDVWAVGDGGAIHWNGTAWAPSPGFPIPPPEVNFRGDVWAVAPNDVWVVGNRNLLTRFNGSGWMTTPITADNTHSLFGVWSDGSTAWAVGQGDQIQKFSGGAWTVIQGAGGSSIGFVNVMARGLDVWVVGQSTLRSTGGGPFQVDPDAPPAPYASFNGLWVTATQVWAAGNAQPNGAATVIHRARF
jgi:hypothetical protein